MDLHDEERGNLGSLFRGVNSSERLNCHQENVVISKIPFEAFDYFRVGV